MSTKFGVAALVVLIVTLVVVGPLLAIWAVNTLFALGIAYTFKNWLAMLVLTTFLGASKRSKSNN